MGAGYGYFCEKCGKDFFVSWGIGFLYPMVYKKILEDIKSGKYGEEMKAAALSNSDVAVDAESHLYVCSCGCWENDYGLSLYVPKEGARIDSPFVSPYSQQDIFQILYKYDHQCPECGETMIEADGKKSGLQCPECKTICVSNSYIRWD